jgi:crotonobetainyl-CoA:carnitine CoA-transferase CaiB-like acyl-CoA transferase
MDTAGHVSSKATPKIAPYITSDDKVLVLCPIEPHLWERFCAVIERPDLLPIEDVGAWDSGTSDLYPIVAEVMRSKTLQEWQELFTGAGVPASAVYSTSEAVHSPLASDRNILWPPAVAGQPSYVGPAVVVDGQRGRPHVSPPPRLGQHNDALLEGAS